MLLNFHEHIYSLLLFFPLLIHEIRIESAGFSPMHLLRLETTGNKIKRRQFRLILGRRFGGDATLASEATWVDGGICNFGLSKETLAFNAAIGRSAPTESGRSFSRATKLRTEKRRTQRR